MAVMGHSSFLSSDAKLHKEKHKGTVFQEKVLNWIVTGVSTSPALTPAGGFLIKLEMLVSISLLSNSLYPGRELLPEAVKVWDLGITWG